MPLEDTYTRIAPVHRGIEPEEKEETPLEYDAPVCESRSGSALARWTGHKPAIYRAALGTAILSSTPGDDLR